MRKTYLVVVMLATLLCMAVAAEAADDELAKTLRGVVESNISAYNAKDVDAAMRGIHTKSPDYESTKAELIEQFQGLPIAARLAQFQYIGHDNEFALVRMKLALAGPPSSQFVDNEVDMVMLFHQENGTWKLWTDKVLGVEFVEFHAK